MMEQFNAQVSHVDGARVYVMLHATRADAAGFPTSNTFAAELMNASLQAADLTDGARTVSVVGVDRLATYRVGASASASDVPVERMPAALLRITLRAPTDSAHLRNGMIWPCEGSPEPVPAPVVFTPSTSVQSSGSTLPRVAIAAGLVALMLIGSLVSWRVMASRAQSRAEREAAVATPKPVNLQQRAEPPAEDMLTVASLSSNQMTLAQAVSDRAPFHRTARGGTWAFFTMDTVNADGEADCAVELGFDLSGRTKAARLIFSSASEVECLIRGVAENLWLDVPAGHVQGNRKVQVTLPLESLIISDDPIQKDAIVATLKMGGELRLNTQTSEGALAIDASTDRATFLSNLTRTIRAPYVSARRVARH